MNDAIRLSVLNSNPFQHDSSCPGLAGRWLCGFSELWEIRQYFTDPIFYTRVPVSQPLSFYRPHTGAAIFSEPLYLGKFTARSAPLAFQSNAYKNVYPFYAEQSDFRNKSLAAMQWEPFEKNWTITMSYATGKSSLKVFEGGAWKNL